MMKKNVKLLSVLLSILSFLFVSGCGQEKTVADIESMLTSDDEFNRALELQKSGEFLEAREAFKRVVVAQPTNSLARLHYAILLQDIAPVDPYAALSNFEAYLVLAPGSEKEDLVNDRIQKARKQISNRFDETSIEDRERKIAEYYNMILSLNKRLETKDRELEENKKLIESITKEKEKEIAQNKRLNVIINTISSGIIPNLATQPTNLNRTYKVEKGDTLWKIARKVYGDPNRVADIRAANGLKEGESLVEGRELIIP